MMNIDKKTARNLTAASELVTVMDVIEHAIVRAAANGWNNVGCSVGRDELNEQARDYVCNELETAGFSYQVDDDDYDLIRFFIRW